MGPETWGPHGWKFIHFITMAYPTHPSKYDKDNYRNFFKDLAHVIPCSLCADNYKDHLRIFPLSNDVLSSRDNLMEWGVKMHNLVNKSNNKKEYSKEEAYKLINEQKNEEGMCKAPKENVSNSFSKKIITVTMIIFGLLLAYQIYLLYAKNLQLASSDFSPTEADL